METPLYKICFPDIFNFVASYLTPREIVNVAAIAVVDAQEAERREKAR